MGSGQEVHLWYDNCNSIDGGSRRNMGVIDEIERSLEVSKQLRILHHFNKSLFLSSAEKLLDEIISSSERALGALMFEPACIQLPLPDDADSENTRKPPSKKRSISDSKKTVTKCMKQVRVSIETGFDGTVEDGFNWRKYGQKDIQGARHPRGYYRCTHRQQAGCMATKHIQRSDEDPLLFYITYRGKHICQSVPETPPSATMTQINPWTTANEYMSLPPFPDDMLLPAECSSLPHFDPGSCFRLDEVNSSTGVSESQVESMESDDGSHLSFDFNGLFSID